MTAAGAQFIRYAVVGLVSNLLLYCAYLAVTTLGIGHKSAASSLYLLGIFQTFVFNRNWTFVHQGRVNTALVRYLAAYAAGYLVNMGMLFLLVDHYGVPHQWVQGAAIVVVAALLFLAQRHWVFARDASRTGAPYCGRQA